MKRGTRFHRKLALLARKLGIPPYAATGLFEELLDACLDHFRGQGAAMSRSDGVSRERGGATPADMRRGKRLAVSRRKRRFLRALESVGKVADAAHAAGVSMRSVARWRADDPAFRSGFDGVEAELILLAEDRLRDLVASSSERIALRAVMFVLERRDRARWGVRDDTLDGATAQEIAEALRQLGKDTDDSIEGPPEGEVA
jgi:hypothetical protein